MNYKTEKALSGRSKCKKCKRKIPRDTIKLIIPYRDEFQHLKQRDYCKRCSITFINKDIRELNKILEKIKRETKREIKRETKRRII